jgi:hypothetical protein
MIASPEPATNTLPASKVIMPFTLFIAGLLSDVGSRPSVIVVLPLLPPHPLEKRARILSGISGFVSLRFFLLDALWMSFADVVL